MIDPRGVRNALTQEPAPARVGLGGLMQIEGPRLGPLEPVTAAAALWPLELGGVKVFVNNRPAAIYSAKPGLVIAQAPPDAPTGLADVVVEQNGQRSRPARVYLDERRPSVKTENGRGWGRPASPQAGTALTLTASGLGATDPALGAGEAGTAKPKANVAVFVGGIPAEASAAASATRPGEFEIRVQAPAGARPGDVISVLVERMAANRTVYRSLAAPEVQFLALPEGAPELRFLTDTDLNGNFLMATGARDDAGCYPAVTFDFGVGRAANVEGCLTAPTKDAASPLVAPAEGAAIGALAGPPQGEAPQPVSSELRIFSPGREPMAVSLPAPASQLAAAGGGDFTAVMPGSPPKAVTVDGLTGEVTEGRAGAGAGGGAGAIPAGLQVEIDGLATVLAFTQINQGRVAVIVGDSASEPTRAKMAVVMLGSGEVVVSKDFPEGWLPLMGAQNPARPAGAPAQQARVSATYDAARRVWYALARTADNARHGFAAFTFDSAGPKALAFPDGWFAATCTPNVRIFNLELSRRAALVGTTTPETSFKQLCPATGFLALDLVNQTVTAAALPVNAQLNSGSAGEINDYVYATDIDPSRRGQIADTLFVLDGVTASPFTLSLPPGVDGFQGLRPVPELSALVGAAASRTAGDQGLIVFKLDEGAITVLPVPEGFNTVVELGVFLPTRKVVARAVRQRASQLVVYGLEDGSLTVVPNPDGVAAAGPVPAAAAGGGGTGAANLARLLSPNAKANTVAGVAYDAEGNQKGVMVVRIP